MQLVADANVLLSAVIGGRAALALRHDKVEQVFTPAAAYDEVFEYLPSLAKSLARPSHANCPVEVSRHAKSDGVRGCPRC